MSLGEAAPSMQLKCPSVVPDPPNGCYPRAPEFLLSQQTRSYTRGYAYVSTWNTANREADYQQLLQAHMPPNVAPGRDDDGGLEIKPIPGMIKLIPGVPFVYHLDGNPGKPVTVACLQTQESLSAYPMIASDVQNLTDHLFNLTFGKVKDGVLTQKPIYQLPGLKRNQ